VEYELKNRTGGGISMLQHDSAGAHEVIWEICALRGLLVECFPDTNDWLSFALMTDGWRIFFFFWTGPVWGSCIIFGWQGR
jgi:hypothetical protein